MKISLAPLEGITTYLYRRRAVEFFTSPDRFFTPYISPASDRLFSVRDLEEILPENNKGIPLVPQLMINRSDLALSAIREIAQMDYREVNLNFGCPSGNVTRKRKGAGILAFPDILEQLLDEICTASDLPISVKTRIGYHSPDEFDRLLSIYCRFPLKELIIHPRVRDEFYSGPLHRDALEHAITTCNFPVVVNGDIRSRADILKRTDEYHGITNVPELMIGRGLIARPDLLDPTPASSDTIRLFHRTLEEDYMRLLPDETAVLVKMKRILTLRLAELPHSTEQRIHLLGASCLDDFHRAYDEILSRSIV